ncbi:hypothetical protein, partial [Burkholderia sp. BCC1999]|uniref:hypothetical protein n=1 Tax=Burkholderia sp. BCC1999 TaxID=2817448 RepID=UPI002AC35A52
DGNVRELARRNAAGTGALTTSIRAEVVSSQSAQIHSGYPGWPSTSNWCCQGCYPLAPCSKWRRSQLAADMVERSNDYSRQLPLGGFAQHRGTAQYVLPPGNLPSHPICALIERFSCENRDIYHDATRCALHFSHPSSPPV